MAVLEYASTAKVTSRALRFLADAGAGDDAGPGKLKPAQQLKVREQELWEERRGGVNAPRCA